MTETHKIIDFAAWKEQKRQELEPIPVLIPAHAAGVLKLHLFDIARMRKVFNLGDPAEISQLANQVFGQSKTKKEDGQEFTTLSVSRSLINQMVNVVKSHTVITSTSEADKADDELERLWVCDLLRKIDEKFLELGGPRDENTERTISAIETRTKLSIQR